MKKTVIYLVTFLFIQLVVSIIVFALWPFVCGQSLREALQAYAAGAMSKDAGALIAASVVEGLVVLLVFVRAGWFNTRTGYIATRPWGVMVWSVLVAVGALVPMGVLQEVLPGTNDLLGETFKAIMSHPAGYLAVGLIAPLVEEVVFRGAILRALLDRFGGRWMPIVISAALFAIVHGNPAQMPGALILGIVMGWMYSHTRSIVPSLIVHWVNNSVAYFSAFLFPGSYDLQMSQLFGGWGHTILATVFSLMIAVPALYQLHLAFKRDGLQY